MNPNALTTLSNIRTDYGDLTELCHSIAMVGVEIPILYYEMGGLNVVKDGHRRLRCVQIINAAHDVDSGDSADIHAALKEGGLLDGAFIQIVNLRAISHRGPITDVPIVRVDPPSNEGDVALFQLVAARDGLRKPLNPMEEARAIATLLKSKSGQDVAKAIGKSEPYVSRRHRLTTLHPDFQEAVAKGEIDPRAAEQLLTLSPRAAEDETLRKSLIAARTVRKIRTKVLAANAAVTQIHSSGEGEVIEVDPLMIALREEAKLKLSMAVNAVRELKAVYDQVDEKPSLGSLAEALAWARREE
jgi:hypothetical protein